MEQVILKGAFYSVSGCSLALGSVSAEQQQQTPVLASFERGTGKWAVGLIKNGAGCASFLPYLCTSRLQRELTAEDRSPCKT
jgi:hypothetical protein